MPANEPAFPQPIIDGEVPIGDAGCGLSKRELFAAMAMQGLLSCQDFVNETAKLVGAKTRDDARSAMASFAVKQADALIAELAKQEEPAK